MHRRTPHLPVALFLLALIALGAGVMLTSYNSAAASGPSQPSSLPGSQAPLTSTIPVVINEVYDSDIPAQEYIELYNFGTISYTLSTFTVYNSISQTTLSGLADPWLRPGQHRAIFPGDLGRTALFGTTGLVNGGDYVGLTNTAAGVVDEVNWGNGPLPSWYGYSIFNPYYFYTNVPTMPSPGGTRSLSRYPDGQDTDSGLDWIATIASPNAANRGPTPTPGTTTPTGTPVGCLDRYEPDDTAQQAGVIEQNTEQVHTFCRDNGATRDRDWVQFPAVAGKVYTMLTKDLTGPVDTVITLYDSQLNFLAESDDYQPGQSLASRIDYTFGASGVYYLQMRDKRSNGGLGYQYTVALISTGALPPTVTPTASPTINPNATATPGQCYDLYEPDGVPETAKLLLINTSQRHSICPETDADWARFYARAGKVYTIRTANLGVGLDTYMLLFDSDARTIIFQNDDGGDGVASRIDFYPQRDDWYYVQVKNAGDIGGPEQTYDLVLAVVPGVPQPPPTGTFIIAPPVTVTSTPVAGSPQPTRPPVATPTQGGILPTPTPNPGATTSVPQPVASAAPTTSAQGAGTGGTAAEPTIPAEPQVPGVPNTGRPPVDKQAAIAKANPKPASVQPPAAKPPAVTFAPLSFRVFYDGNRNDRFDAGEGLRGLSVMFLDPAANLSPTGSLVTGGAGTGTLRLPVVAQRVYIPYLGINIELTQFPEREMHSLWLPPVNLPDRVP